MAVELLADWRLPGCGDRCGLGTVLRRNGRQFEPIHDPETHEAYGRLQVTGSPDRLVRTAGLVVNLSRLEVHVYGQPRHLSPGCWRLLIALAERAGEMVPYQDLQAALDGISVHGVRITATRLRTYLGPAGGLVEVAIGRGWRLSRRPPGEACPPLFSPRWARDWAACQSCGTVEYPHNARGRCDRCAVYWRQYGRERGPRQPEAQP